MKPIKIYAVGDMMFGDSNLNIGSGIRSYCRRYGYSHSFSKVKDILNICDCVLIGNLECALSSNKAAYRTKPYIGDIELVDVLHELGFDVVNLANNHTFEYGLNPATETQDKLEQLGITPIGLSTNNSNEGILNINGISLGFLGFSMVPTIKFDLFERNLSKIIKSVELSASKHDLVIISIHWGAEFVTYPSKQQIQFAHRLIDAGADVVLGHHPHVLQPIELYKSGLIAYSLGNFIFDTPWMPLTRKSIILDISIPINRDEEILANVIPILINDDYQPVPVSDSRLCIEDFNNNFINNFTYQNNSFYSDIEFTKIADHNRHQASMQMKQFFLKQPHKISLSTYKYLISKRVSQKLKRRKTITSDLQNTPWKLT